MARRIGWLHLKQRTLGIATPVLRVFSCCCEIATPGITSGSATGLSAIDARRTLPMIRPRSHAIESTTWHKAEQPRIASYFEGSVIEPRPTRGRGEAHFGTWWERCRGIGHVPNG